MSLTLIEEAYIYLIEDINSLKVDSFKNCTEIQLEMQDRLDQSNTFRIVMMPISGSHCWALASFTIGTKLTYYTTLDRWIGIL